MPISFYYNPEVFKFKSELKVENIGNIAIKATDEFDLEYYLIIRSTLGKVQIFNYGPLDSGNPIIPDSVNCHFCRTNFDFNKIYKIIDKFLSESKYKGAQIVKAETLDIQEALTNCIDLIDYMYNFDEVNQY